MLLGTGTVGFSRDPKEPAPSVRRRLLGERLMAHDAQGGQLCNMFHFCKPVIAQVQGYCYGQHFTIATACDMVVASEDALFTHPAFRYIVEAWPMGVWWDMLGPHRVAEMVFTGRPFTAQEMYIAGLVNHVVSRKNLEEETVQMAEVVARQNIDQLMVFKHYLETLRAVRNDLVGPNMVGCFAHMISTYMKMEQGDFSILKETTKGGAKGAIDHREDRYPPRYRLSMKRRAEK
jgi:enoyl-CoA hydratase/carnithine racemase